MDMEQDWEFLMEMKPEDCWAESKPIQTWSLFLFLSMIHLKGMTSILQRQQRRDKIFALIINESSYQFLYSRE